MKSLQAILSSVFLAKQRFFRPTAYTFYRRLLSLQELDQAKLAAFNLNRRRALLFHAGTTTEKYAHWKSANASAFAYCTEDTWDGLPILTREEVSDDLESLRSKVFPRTRLVESTTGGSTGTPLRVWHDRLYPREAIAWRLLGWWNVPLGQHAAHTWRLRRTRRLSQLANTALWWPTQRIWLNAAAMRKEDLNRFIDEFNHLRPQLLQGYVGALEHVAAHIIQQELVVPSPIAIWTTAAPLNPNSRHTIQEAFQAPVYDQYGSCEVPFIAAECERHEGLHVFSDVVQVDIVRDDGSPADAGQVGRVLVTDLDNRVAPLIRYDTGDRAAWLAGPCSCGLPFPRITTVRGRVSDTLVMNDGTTIAGDYLTTIFDNYTEEIRQFQVQKITASQLRVLVCPRKQKANLDSIISAVHAALRANIGKTTMIEFQIVENISADAGKTRFVLDLTRRNLA